MIRLHGTLRQQEALYLLLDLCDGPDLWSALQEHGPFAEAHATLYAACIASAISHLHARRWMYRDLKAENVVFCADGSVSIVDLGLARRCIPPVAA